MIQLTLAQLRPGWVEWDRDGRDDGIQSFHFAPAGEKLFIVHTPAGRHSAEERGNIHQVIRSPYGIALTGRFPTLEEAMIAAEQIAVKDAEEALRTAAKETQRAQLLQQRLAELEIIK